MTLVIILACLYPVPSQLASEHCTTSPNRAETLSPICHILHNDTSISPTPFGPKSSQLRRSVAMTSQSNTGPKQERQLTVRLTPAKGRFTFNSQATRWFAERAITRISIHVDPILRSVTVRAASTAEKSRLLTFLYHKPNPLPVQAIFDSRPLVSHLGYEKGPNSTFLITSLPDALVFLADPEYALRSSLHVESSGPKD